MRVVDGGGGGGEKDAGGDGDGEDGEEAGGRDIVTRRRVHFTCSHFLFPPFPLYRNADADAASLHLARRSGKAAHTLSRWQQCNHPIVARCVTLALVPATSNAYSSA